jgi:hypothetical protein
MTDRPDTIIAGQRLAESALDLHHRLCAAAIAQFEAAAQAVQDIPDDPATHATREAMVQALVSNAGVLELLKPTGAA